MDRCDGFLDEPLVVVPKLVEPKRPHHWVGHLADHPPTVLRIGEDPLEPQEAYVLAFKESRNGGVEDVFEAGSPGGMPNAPEG